MSGNNLSFSITARNAATSALNSLQNQVNSLKNGIKSIGNSTNATSNYLNSLNRSTVNSSRSFGTLGSTIKRTIGIFGGFKIVNTIFNTIGNSIGRAFERMDTMDLFSQKMEFITGSSELATQALENLKKSTKGTPYALDIAARGVQNFVTRGMQTKNAVDSINIWMDAVSAYGKGTNEQFESVTDAISKMRTKGTVEMRYLNRLFAAGINPVKMYAQATGMAAEEVQEKLSAKEIKADDFLNVVEEAMRNGTNGVKKVEGMAKQLATTWAATTANMSIAIARGLVELVNGADKIAQLFNAKGLKGMVAGFGEGVENLFTKIGSTIGTVGTLAKNAYNQMKTEQQAYFDFTEKQVKANSDKISAHYNSAGVRFRDGFFNSFAPYLEQAILKFEALRGVWSNVSETFSAGIAKISDPLGRLVGTYLGETVTGIEDIGIAFGNWLNLRLPAFFDKLERVLNWFIEHKDGVVNSAKLILKALMGFTVLNTIQNVILSFNDKLKALNNTLAFFTLGKIQFPTLESIYNNGFEKKNQRALETMQRENDLARQRNSLEAVYNRDTNKVKAQTTKEIAGLDKNQIRDEIKISTAHKKANEKLVTDRTKAVDKINLDKDTQLNKLNTTYLASSQKADSVYNSEISKINKTKDADTLRIIKAQQTAVNKTSKNGAASNALLKSYGLTSADYATNKIMSQAEIEKNSKLFDQIYQDMKSQGISPSSSPILNDIYNSRSNAEIAKQKAVSTRDATKSNLLDTKRTKTEAIELATATKLNKVSKDYEKNVAALNNNTRSQMGRVRSGYTAKKNSVNANSRSSLAGIQTAYDIGLQALEPEPKKKGNKFTSWIKDSFVKTGQGAKNIVSKGTEKVKGTTGKVISNVAGGFEKFANVKVGDIADDFKALGQTTKNVTKKTGSGIASGVGNFFGTMFSGFKGLGKGQSATVALSGAEEATSQAGLLTTVIGKLSGAFQAVTGWVTSFVTTIGGAVVGIGAAAVAIGALAAGLGVLNPGNKVSDGINKFFESFGEWCSTVADNAPILIQNFVNKLREGLPQLTSQGVNLLLSIVNGILTGIPQLLTVGASILFSLIGGIAQVLPDLVFQGFSAIGQFIAGIIQNLPNILRAAGELIKTVVKGILTNLPVILASGVKLIWSFITGIGSMLSQVWTALKDLIVNSVTWVWNHPQEIWDSIKNLCGELWNALLSGLYAAADMFNAGWLLDALGAVRPEAAEGGADAAQAAIDGANQRASSSFLDMKSLIMQGNKEEAELAAQQAGTDVAGAYVDTVDAEMAQEAIDAGQYGTDTATNYTDNLSSGITAGGESVDQALSSVGAEGLANLQVTFNSEQLAQVGADFMNGLNNSLVTNAPIVYQSIAVFTNNCLTQLQAGLNNPERAIPQTIADALVSLLAGITQQVIDYCAQINTKLADCYNQLITLIDTTLSTFATKHTTTISSIFPQFQNDIAAHLGDAVQKYTDFSNSVSKILDDLNTYHYDIGAAMMTSLKDGIELTMPQVTSTEDTLVQKLKDTFEKGMGIHSPADQWIWYGQMLIAGLIEGMPADKVLKFIDNMINDMNTSFKNGNFSADQTVNFLSEQGTLDLIGKVTGLDMGTMSDTIAYPLSGTKGTITSYFGNRESPGGIGSTNHQGMDLATATGTPILSALAGTVSIADWYGGYGQAVVVDSGNGLEIVYGHMSQIGATVGQTVQKGQQIGLVGSTGNSTGPHLHFEMRQNGTAIDPLPFLGGAQVAAGNTLAAVLQNAYNKKYHPELLANMASSNNGNVNWDSNSGAGQWANLVLQALKMLGQPASLLGAVLATLQKESSGNPNAINLSDINATLYGTPSKGLMQVIDPTFQAYALPGYNTNIWDPLSNILASLNYQLHTYGGIYAHLNGYAVGTRNVPQDMLAQIHKGEAIIPASQNPYSSSGGDYLADLFNNAIGNTGINDLNFDLSSIEGGSSSGNNVNNNFNNVFNIHNNSDVDADRNLSNMEAALHRMLQDGMRSSSSR